MNIFFIHFKWCINKLHKVNFRCRGSYIDYPDWKKKEKSNDKSDKKNDKCFQYAVTVALNDGKIESHPERVSNIKPFVNKHNKCLRIINYLSKRDDWKTIEKNSPTIAPNIWYIKEKEICQAYISRINSNCEKQIILLIIPNEEKEGWHYLAVKKLSKLLRGITSKQHCHFFV